MQDQQLANLSKDLISNITNNNFESNNPLESIDHLLKNDQFKNMLQNLSGTLGVDSQEISSTLDDPNFSKELTNMASNIDISKIANMAGGLFNIDKDQIDQIKDSISVATNQMKDLVSKPSDISITIDISACDSYTGIRKKITVKRLRYESAKHAFVQERQKLVLNIPPGTRTGRKFVISNEGDEYLNSKEELNRSDLIIHINVEDDEKFQLIGNDLYYNLSTSVSDFLEDKFYKITFIDSVEITLFKPKEFKLQGRLVGLVKGLGMPPDSDKSETSSETESSITEERVEVAEPVGDLIILFNIKHKGVSKLEQVVSAPPDIYNEKEILVNDEDQKNNYWSIIEHSLDLIIV
tara:strand:+ start:1057 stop:2112 length:1056 start_codon:yes stop_codon:yes gene_type:complete